MAKEPMTLEDQARIVQSRLKSLGLTTYAVPTNNGARQTQAKKVLLQELDAASKADTRNTRSPKRS